MYSCELNNYIGLLAEYYPLQLFYPLWGLFGDP